MGVDQKQVRETGEISKSGKWANGRHRTRRPSWTFCLLLAALCWALVGAVGCREQDPWLRNVQKAGVLRVGIDPSWPPFEFLDPKSGEIVGLDVDLAQAIGRRLGVTIAFVPSGWEGLYSALSAGQFDAILSALPYDPWRTQEAAYSISYFNAGTVVVVHAENADIDRPQDLAGRTLHVEFGAEGDVQARKLQKKVDGLEIVAHETAQEALAATLEHVGSATIVDAVSARLFVREGNPLQITGDPLYDELYVIAVHPRAESLQEAIDQALIDMRESGELEALLNRWL